ncbi:MAG: hypothetical protein KKD18_00130 [Nanoarchaeota archaeon]|nr:hypothetical protein [Nanoarchaeota archaeon]MBU0976805.1 hypothetical protein [Nanoarchaeota archaeon]
MTNTLIYVSTDPEEAHALIHGFHDFLNPGGGNSYDGHKLGERSGTHHDYSWDSLDLTRAKQLQRELNFHPGCCIGIPNQLETHQLNTLTKSFTREGLYVAVKTDGNLTIFSPPNKDLSQELLRSASYSDWDQAEALLRMAGKLNNTPVEKLLKEN